MRTDFDFELYQSVTVGLVHQTNWVNSYNTRSHNDSTTIIVVIIIIILSLKPGFCVTL